ncbi:zinc finger protein CONSTANS-like 9-like, partial [Trifolium pratense]
MLLMGEPPWLNTCPENELQLKSANRCSVVMRYKEKKKIH